MSLRFGETGLYVEAKSPPDICRGRFSASGVQFYPRLTAVSLRNGGSGTIPGMVEPPELQHNGHWRMAVWSLRVGYVGLTLAIAGLIVLLSGGTPWILAVGMTIWLAVVVVTLTGFLWARNELPAPRPRLWSMRFMLIHDTVHARSSAQRS